MQRFVLLAAFTACVPNSTAELACATSSDCDSGRVCDRGFCVVNNSDQPPDAADDADVDATPVDAPPDAPPDATPDARLCAGGDAAVTDATTGACFVLFRTPLTRPSAEAACAAAGMHLAIIKSAATNTLVRTLVGNLTAFLGATDVVTENQFLWPDGTGLSFVAFRGGEPNNGGGDFQEDCVVIEGSRGGTWDDRACAPPPNNTGVFPYVCQFD